MANIATHYHLREPEIDFKLNTITQRIYTEVVDMFDDSIVQACVRTAKEAGLTDLVLLDKRFVLEALIEKMEREKEDHDA